MPLADQRSQFPILGRVALGYLTTGAGGKTYPARSETLVFTADDEDLLRQVAGVLGGPVEPSPAQNDAGEARWRVITAAKELHVRMPTEDDRSFSQWYERWGRGGIVRRCDGVTCQFAVTEAGAEPARDVPCICKAQDLPDDERCDPTTRLNVVAEELFQVSRMGLWQITSRGWDSTREIAAAIELLRAGGNVVGIPLLLRVEQRTRRAKDGRSYTFPIYTLVPLVSFSTAARLAKDRPHPLFGITAEAPEAPTPTPPVPALPSPGAVESPPPPTPPSDPVRGADMAGYLRKEPPGKTVEEKIAYLRSVCREYTEQLGLSSSIGKLWRAVSEVSDPDRAGLPEFRRMFAVLQAISVGIDPRAAVAGVLRIWPLGEGVPSFDAEEEDIPF